MRFYSPNKTNSEQIKKSSGGMKEFWPFHGVGLNWNSSWLLTSGWNIKNAAEQSLVAPKLLCSLAKSATLRSSCSQGKFAKKNHVKSLVFCLASPYVLPIARVSKVFNRNLHHHQDPNFCVCHHYLQYCFNLFAQRESFSNGLVECCVFCGSSVICFYFYSRKFLKNMNFLFLFLLSKL